MNWLEHFKQTNPQDHEEMLGVKTKELYADIKITGKFVGIIGILTVIFWQSKINFLQMLSMLMMLYLAIGIPGFIGQFTTYVSIKLPDKERAIFQKILIILYPATIIFLYGMGIDDIEEITSEALGFIMKKFWIGFLIIGAVLGPVAKSWGGNHTDLNFPSRSYGAFTVGAFILSILLCSEWKQKDETYNAMLIAYFTILTMIAYIALTFGIQKKLAYLKGREHGAQYDK